MMAERGSEEARQHQFVLFGQYPYPTTENYTENTENPVNAENTENCGKPGKHGRPGKRGKHGKRFPYRYSGFSVFSIVFCVFCISILGFSCFLGIPYNMWGTVLRCTVCTLSMVCQ